MDAYSIRKLLYSFLHPIRTRHCEGLCCVLYLAVVTLSLIIGLLRGGQLRPDITIRHGWAAVAALALQVAAWLVPTRWEDVPATVISYAGLGLFVYLNRTLFGLRAVMIGLMLNMLVMSFNGARMPVQPEAAAVAGVDLTAVYAGAAAKHAIMDENTQLAILGDVIPVPMGPVSRVISIGDIFVFLGAFLLVQEMVPPRTAPGIGPEESTQSA